MRSPRFLDTPGARAICRPRFPPMFLEGGAGERVQGARAAYGTCFVSTDRPGPSVIPTLLCLPTFCLIRHIQGDSGIKTLLRRFLPMSGSDQGRGSDVLDVQDRARFEQ